MRALSTIFGAGMAFNSLRLPVVESGVKTSVRVSGRVLLLKAENGCALGTCKLLLRSVARAVLGCVKGGL